MASLPQWQKKYPDTLKVTAKTEFRLSSREIRRMADGILGKESTILQASVRDTKTTVYLSKEAFKQGVKDESPIFG
jgi:hypothetical protein